MNSQSNQSRRWLQTLLRLLPVAALIPGSALLAMEREDCSVVQQAHQRLLQGSFKVVREFRLLVNGDLKNRELARLNYSAGELETEVLEYQAFSKMWVHENEGKDFILEIPFACERIEVTGADRYKLTSEDGLEVALLDLDEQAGALRLVAWRSDDSARVLFKKFVVKARAEYTEFEWMQTQRLPHSDDNDKKEKNPND